jgi:ABC-2 type transport system ATP-binding protein
VIAMPSAALSAEDVTYRYGSFVALSRVSLTLEAGEIDVLLGHNGAGKSTLLRCLAGWQRVESGRILLDGQPMRAAQPHQGRPVLVPDTPSFYAELTAWEHLQFIAQLYGRTNWQDAAQRLFTVFGLAAHRAAYPSSFSRGMQYKLALSIALLVQPSVLLLDEPFGPLDSDSSVALWHELEAYAHGGGAVLAAAHQMPDIVRPHRYLRLRDGRVVADGPDEELDAAGPPEDA